MAIPAPPRDLQAEKRALRAAMRQRRGSITPDQAMRAGVQAAGLLEEHLAGRLRAARLALLYSALPGELDTGAIELLLLRRGARVAWPRVGNGIDLHLHVASGDDLRPGRFAIREPDPSAPAVGAGEIDLVIVPGLAFDRTGHRLGFGRGYYDALLARAPQAIRYGACLPYQLVPNVPAEPHDQRMDFVVADELIATGARPLPEPEVAP
ncbi:MAG: 5-formyltetrahydrofolate cyclo-ligase [Myxococcales bacterium]|nr:5-formyltetrahydrofolate cyclo-ligase [Myxococcales bacterium]